MGPLSALPLDLSRLGSRSLAASLHTQLRTAILDGRLKAGLRLPSTRALARQYRVSRNTVVAAYDLLLSEGYVSARRGSGTMVTELLPRPTARPGPDAGRGLERRLNAYWRRQGLQRTESGRGAPRFSFQLGAPDARSFPYEIWRTLTGRVLRRFRSGRAEPGGPQGLAACRQAIAAHVSFTRAVACGPENVIVTAGAQQAFDLLAQVLTIPGRSTVAVEDPGYPPLRAAFRSKAATIRPVPVDAEGIRVDRIPASAGVICVTPSHQFPLGAVMSSLRRAELLEHCRRRGAVVIEDDYDGEFRFEDRPLDALQTLDCAQRVFYVGTFSKTLLPDLRLGYIVSPPWATKALVAAKRVADGECSAMLQAALALLIGEGHLARHVRRMQRIYGRRRAMLLDGLRCGFSRWLEPLPSIAGLHVTCRLRIDCDEHSLVAAALDQEVLVHALRPHFAGPAALRGLILGYGAIDEQDISAGLARLRRAMPR